MSHADRVKDVIGTGGTGNITLAGTPPDATYFALAAVGGAGATFDYWIADGTNVEIGKGTVVSTNVFSRVVQKSTNSNAAVSWSAGAVFQTDISAATLNAFIDATSAQTLTNKRITARVLALGSGATPTINTDLYDRVTITGLVANITSFTTNLTGTPVDGDSLVIAITSAAAQTLAWGSGFEDGLYPCPTTTVPGQKLTIPFDRNAATSKWRCMGTA